MHLNNLRLAHLLFVGLVYFAGCGGRQDRALQANVSELEAFEAQQKIDREADLEAMKIAGPNASP